MARRGSRSPDGDTLLPFYREPDSGGRHDPTQVRGILKIRKLVRKILLRRYTEEDVVEPESLGRQDISRN